MTTVETEARLQARAWSIGPRTLVAAALGGGGLLFVLGLIAGRPITFPDELIYSGAARSLAAGHGLEVAGTPISAWTYGPLYLLILAPIYRLAPNLQTAYLIARAMNALLFASAAIPLFLIARRVVSVRSARLAAAAGVALPACVYTTKLQTESLAYPIAMWVALATLSVIATPTKRRQIVLVGLIVAAALVRFELVALAPAASIACYLCAKGATRARLVRLSVLFVSLAGASVVSVSLALAAVARGSTDVHGLSLRSFSIGVAVVELAGSFAALALATGLVPLALVIAAGLDALSRQKSERVDVDIRPTAIVAMSFAINLIVVGSGYLAAIPSAWRPSLPSDRYVFYTVPLTFIVFGWWLEAGAPSSRRLRLATWVCAAAVVVVAASEVHGARFTVSGAALSFMPWMFLRALTPSFTWLVLLAGYCLGCAYVVTQHSVVPRRVTRVVVGAVAACTMMAFTYVGLGAWNASRHSPPAGWLDARTDSSVVGIWASKPTDRQAFALWEVQVMNRNLARVYYVRKPDRLGPAVRVERRADGELLDRGKPVSARYALTSASTRIVGMLVSRRNGLALYKVEQPLRLAAELRGGSAPTG